MSAAAYSFMACEQGRRDGTPCKGMLEIRPLLLLQTCKSQDLHLLAFCQAEMSTTEIMQRVCHMAGIFWALEVQWWGVL